MNTIKEITIRVKKGSPELVNKIFKLKPKDAKSWIDRRINITIHDPQRQLYDTLTVLKDCYVKEDNRMMYIEGVEYVWINYDLKD